MNIKRRIIQGGVLYALTFVLCLIPFSLALKKAKTGYQFKDRVSVKKKMTYLLYIDDKKLLVRIEIR